MFTISVITVAISQGIALYYKRNEVQELYDRNKFILAVSFAMSMSMLYAMFYYQWYWAIIIGSLISIITHAYLIIKHER